MLWALRSGVNRVKWHFQPPYTRVTAIVDDKGVAVCDGTHRAFVMKEVDYGSLEWPNCQRGILAQR
jgi:hypothetical protein